ncbi:MAG: LCP family protein, partial [Pseudonocardiaceae bacterium]
GPPHDPPRRPRRPLQRERPRRRRWGFRRVATTLLTVFALVIAGVWVYLEFAINRVDALEDYDGRPAAAEGTNWLIVGSDSREGLDADERKRLHTGAPEGTRTDTIMLAHIPDNDTKPILMSVPRDLNVEIPGHGIGKINAAFSIGGPKLLARTVEHTTGLHIDHYAEIGFGGFANVVDAIGGVTMDVPEGMVDGSNGVEIPAGRQELDGAQALSFVRMRKSEATPRSDLDRVANQREFIGALAGEIASPGTLLNPFHLIPLLSAAPDALTVDTGDHVHHLAGLGWATRGIGSGGMITTTVPVSSAAATNLDEVKAAQLFEALRTDTEVPDGLLSD